MFKKYRYLLLLLAIGLLLVASVLYLVKRKRYGVLVVDASSDAAVYINGVEVGETPYEAEVLAGEIVLKLVPTSKDAPYSSKLPIIPYTKTIVRRSFGDSELTSSTSIVFLKKNSNMSTRLQIISIPDTSDIYIGGQLQGKTPFLSASTQPARSEVTIKKNGFEAQQLAVQTIKGYTTTLIVSLKSSRVALQNNVALPSVKVPVFVIVQTTPNGFLRVRAEPNVQSDEVMQITPQSKYEFVEESEDKKWYKIKLTDGSEGWVSNQYVKKESE